MNVRRIHISSLRGPDLALKRPHMSSLSSPQEQSGHTRELLRGPLRSSLWAHQGIDERPLVLQHLF